MQEISPSTDELGLFTDLYELTMAQAYWAERMHEPAVFSLFFRKLSRQRNVVLACGQEHAARLAVDLRFPRNQLDRLADLDLFQDRFLAWLECFRFSGDIHTVAEGTPVFPHEPLLEIRAPIIEAQVLESVLMNYINLETVLASKAARVVLAADGRPVNDFGMRRMHGMDAALRGVRAYRVAGVAGTSNILGSLQHGLPPRGTMAHSFIQAHADETEAFRVYARLYPGTTLLVDTYYTLTAVDRIIRLIRDEGMNIGALRLDSGDLLALTREARQRLDRAGLPSVKLVVSGGLDEWKIRELLDAGAPIDGFGVGTEMGTASDAPALDFAYKLTEYAGQPRLKNSPGKQLLPGAKQVWRFRDTSGRYSHDEITRRQESRDAMPLLKPVINNGEPCNSEPDIDQARERARADLEHMPADLRQLDPMDMPYPVHVSPALEDLRMEALANLNKR